MSEMNTPKDSRTGLSEKLDGILTSNPNDLCAAALKEMLPQLPAAQAEKILNRLNREMPTSKVEGGAGSEATGAPLSPQVERWIKTLKENPDRQFRAEAASNLGERKDPSAVEPLIRALKDEDEDVRCAAAKALVPIGSPAVPALIEALKDEDSRVRYWAAKALGSIEDPRAVPALCSALKYWDGDAKIYLVEMLGKIKDPRAVEPLAVALLDNWDYLRRNAAEALGAIGDESATGWLCASLREDEAPAVRRAAARALGKIKDPSAVPELIEALTDVVPWAQYDQDSGVRFRAFEALVSIGAPAVPALCEALKKNQSWWLRLKAVEVLQAIGDPSAIKTLNFRLNGFLGRFGRERDIRVRLEIKDAIQKLEGN